MFSSRLKGLTSLKNFASSSGKKRGRPSKIEETKKEKESTLASSPMAPKESPMAPNPVTTTAKQLIEVFVNDKPVQIAVGSVIIQACAAAGIDIPRFCYHERLAIAGNCRMCLVQVEKMPKLIASCSQPVAPGMRIQTQSAQVKKAREGVMEFLLANHPLDCAICDQGGECDLQDQAMGFGSDRSRFNLETEHKRAVENKDFGPLIKTSMNRCIHCTRCVRFGNEVAGLEELGTTGRGNDMQIGTYVQSMLGSELSANIIDLCPVGALTSRPYEFAARPWELRKTESIDVMDAVGSAIRIDTRGIELMRIQPRTNDQVNEEWLSDKSRFVTDGLKSQRLTKPAVAGQETNWGMALSTAAGMIKESGDRVAVVAGPFADTESLIAAGDLVARDSLFIAPSLYDNEALDNVSSIKLPCDHSSLFRSGLTLEQMESIDTLLLIGCNMRHEAPLLNSRLRKAFLKGENFSAGLIGCSADAQLNFDFDWLGGDLNSLQNLENTPFWELICRSERPAVFISNALITDHPDGPRILENVMKIVKELEGRNEKFIRSDWNGLCWIPRAASHVGSRLVGYNQVATRSALSQYKTLLLLGSPDTIRHDTQNLIYIGHHADRLAPVSSVILPSCAYTEKSATFVNLEGRLQRTQPAMAGPGESRSDWAILRALSEIINPHHPLPYDTLQELRLTRMSHLNTSILPYHPDSTKLAIRNYKPSSTISTTKPSNFPFKTVNIPDFYLTDPLSRSSATMAKCSIAFSSKIAKSSLEVDEKFKEIINCD